MPERILNRVQWSRLSLYVGVTLFLFEFVYLVAIRPFVPSQVIEVIIVIAIVPLGFVLGKSIYFQRAHLEIRYDDKGFQIMKGRKEVENRKWSEFTQTSIFADSYGERSVRMYFERDQLYVDIPVSKAGGDAFEVRSFAQSKLRK